MAQSGSSSHTAYSSLGASDKLSIPVGQNLSNSSTRTKIPSPGALAYDSGINRMYFGDSSSWNILDIGTGGDVFGPGSSVSGNVVGFTGTDGKHIYDTGFVISGNSSGTNTGDVTLTAFGNAPNANGASLTGQQLQLQPANTSNPGGVNVSAQSFAGVKTFTNGVSFASFPSILNVYSQDTVAVAWSGAVNPTNGSIIFERIGNMCYVTIPTKIFAAKSVAGAGASITITPTPNPIPAQYIPSSLTFGTINVYSSVNPFAASDQEYSLGVFSISNGTGIIQIGTSIATTTNTFVLFANAGSGLYNGVPSQTIMYKFS